MSNLITQSEAHEIIKNTYGDNAYALGCSVGAIFWLYDGEDEEMYKVHKYDTTTNKEETK